MLNLWEGNIGEMFGSDGYFGGSSHGVLFRSYITGRHPRSGNTDSPIRLLRLAYFYSLVGNVLGDSAGFSPVVYESLTQGCPIGIYALGFPNIGNCNLSDETGHPVPGGMSYPDAKVKTTLFRWGNFDRFNMAARFQSSEVPSDVPVPSLRCCRAVCHRASPHTLARTSHGRSSGRM